MRPITDNMYRTTIIVFLFLLNEQSLYAAFLTLGFSYLNVYGVVCTFSLKRYDRKKISFFYQKHHVSKYPNIYKTIHKCMNIFFLFENPREEINKTDLFNK